MAWASVFFKTPPADGPCGDASSETIALRVGRTLSGTSVVAADPTGVG